MQSSVSKTPQLAAQPVAVGAAVAAGAAVVDVDHAEAAARPVEELAVERRGGVRGRPAVALHDQRRTFARRAPRSRGWRAGRRRRAPSRPRPVGNSIAPRDRDVGGVDRLLARLAHHVGLARGEVEDEDRGLALGAGGGEGDLGAAGRERGEAEGGVGQAEVAHALGAGLEQPEPFGRALGAHDGDRAVREERVGGAAEEPLGVAEVGPLGAELGRALAIEAVEVPPAVAVGDEVQPSCGVPGGLEDRLLRAAGEAPGGGRVGERGEPELGPVPGHVRVIPAGPGEQRAVGAESREGIEVAAGGEHLRPPPRRRAGARRSGSPASPSPCSSRTQTTVRPSGERSKSA